MVHRLLRVDWRSLGSTMAAATEGSHQRSFQLLLNKCSLGTVGASNFQAASFADTLALASAITAKSITIVQAVTRTAAYLGCNPSEVGMRRLVPSVRSTLMGSYRRHNLRWGCNSLGLSDKMAVCSSSAIQTILS